MSTARVRTEIGGSKILAQYLFSSSKINEKANSEKFPFQTPKLELSDETWQNKYNKLKTCKLNKVAHDHRIQI